jgi:hypothetical protein
LGNLAAIGNANICQLLLRLLTLELHKELRLKMNLKKVESASVATAFARYDFPVPGGPYRRKARHGLRLPISTA